MARYARVAWLDAGDARRQGPGITDGTERLEPENGPPVNASTCHEIGRALEAACLVFLSTGRGQGVLLVDDREDPEGRHLPIHRCHGRISRCLMRCIRVDENLANIPTLCARRRGLPGVIMVDLFEDTAPSGDRLTDYDTAHIKLYVRLLDASADGADWREVVKVLFAIDPDSEPDRARHVHASHLTRARWMIRTGYRHLLRLPSD